jgi:hypothetical protein
MSMIAVEHETRTTSTIGLIAPRHHTIETAQLTRLVDHNPLLDLRHNDFSRVSRDEGRHVQRLCPIKRNRPPARIADGLKGSVIIMGLTVLRAPAREP